MKAIIIARVSTEEQKEAGNSLPAQIAVLKATAKEKDTRLSKSLVLTKVPIKTTEPTLTVS